MSDTSQTTLLSIVVPAYNEQDCLAKLHQEICRVLDPHGMSWEMLIVDDGSTDDTARVIETLVETDLRVEGIHLARNFGHQAALLAGLAEARGQAVVTIDADLEQPPASILEMLALWKQGYQIVHGVRRDHPELSFFKRKTSRWFYRVFSFLTRIPIEPGMLDFRLFDRTAVDAILSLQEADFFLRGIAAWVGFKQAKLPYQAGLRSAGQTKYSTRAMIAFAMRGITSFSTFPLRLATYLGLMMTLLSTGYGIYVTIRHFFWERPQPGYASTILLISFLMGVQFLLTGVLGEYVGRIHVEVKHRPRYIVARKVSPTPDCRRTATSKKTCPRS